MRSCGRPWRRGTRRARRRPSRGRPARSPSRRPPGRAQRHAVSRRGTPRLPPGARRRSHGVPATPTPRSPDSPGLTVTAAVPDPVHVTAGAKSAPSPRRLSSIGVFDHLLVDVIGTIRDSFDRALLQRQAVEERFQVDVFLGDVSWETSYSLPGEEQPPRVRADVSVDWPTWSQSSYRSWSIGEPPEDLPEVVVEITLRLQRLSAMPDLDLVLACLPEESPPIGTDTLVRAAPVVEQVHEPDQGPRFAVETSYQGTIRL